jgi:hypothetical protein
MLSKQRNKYNAYTNTRLLGTPHACIYKPDEQCPNVLPSIGWYPDPGDHAPFRIRHPFINDEKTSSHIKTDELWRAM